MRPGNHIILALLVPTHECKDVKQLGLRALGTDFLDRISIPWSRPAAASAPEREYDMIAQDASYPRLRRLNWRRAVR